MRFLHIFMVGLMSRRSQSAVEIIILGKLYQCSMNCFNLLLKKKVRIILKQFPSQANICCNVAPTTNSVKNSAENSQCAGHMPHIKIQNTTRSIKTRAKRKSLH